MPVNREPLRLDSSIDRAVERPSHAAPSGLGDLDQPHKFGRMVGQSPPMCALFGLLKRASASDATVLIDGETGTGKEVSALAIHENSARSKQPFIVVDCGAIPAQLLESELFGYERGAFTGAVAARTGAFEAADGGTIFLDEIGELSLDLQPKILRALEGRKVKRVGSNTYFPINVRVIAATNRNLREEVAAKRFRSDLYYRLAVLHIKLPPLRERKGDLPSLVDDVLTHLGVRDTPLAVPIRAPEFIEMLGRYRWPGNVRQLRNYLERRVALGEAIAPPGSETSMPPPPNAEAGESLSVSLDQPLKLAREEWNNVFEARYLEGLLDRHGNNVSAAARAAGVNRVHFYRLLRKHGLREQELDPFDER
ncbi:MAG: putative sigma54 specific transcriptional regulator [Myxococcaceae bacterium]|nr:putative sigma54 specific transcriptional regulator [Myxococcaceae bacterium]